MSTPRSYATESLSSRACLRWRCERDLAPLVKVLKSGEANAEAQALAAELLMLATQRKLPDTKKNHFRPAEILAQWGMAQAMGKGSEDAKRAVAEMFDVSVKAVEKYITKNPKLVAQLKAELKF